MNDHENEPAKNEALRLENDFLKMKLMLEQGAHFGSVEGDADAFTPDIENQFLRNIMEFEKQFAEQKKIKVFEKIGRPPHFKPIKEIPEGEFDEAWNALDEYLHNYAIDLAVCSPNISKKELYRFTVEELFEYEMDDMDIPGMTHCFTYDEFHPDHEYENINAATADCVTPMLEKRPFEWMHHFKGRNLRLNDHFPLTEEEFKNMVNRFKSVYDDIELKAINNTGCVLDDKKCRVTGNYSIAGKLSFEEILLQGNWLVEFEADEDFYYWYIVNVQVEGIRF